MKNNKMIFVGPEVIHEAFAKMGQYDFQQPITSLEEFQMEMSLPEKESKVSKSSSVIIIFSRLYTGNEREFAKIVAFYSPYAVICILTPEQDKAMIPKIETLIRAHKRERESKVASYNSSVPSYFVSYENAIPEIIQSMVEFVSDKNIHKDVKAGVLDMLPGHYKNAVIVEAEFEEANDMLDEIYGDNDKVVIPEEDETHTGRVISVTSSKGGSGKSTVSIVLAAFLAKSSRISEELGVEKKRLKVCVVDFDTRDGQLGFLNGLTSPTVFDILTHPSVIGNKIPQDAIKKGVYSSPTIEADFIFAPRRGRHAKEIQAQFYVSIIHELKSMYDYVILDTSVNYLDVLLEEVAYPMSDKIIFVTDMGISSIMGMARWISETTRAKEKGGSGIDKNKIGITVNKVMDGVNMGADRIKKTSMGVPIIAMLPNVPKLITYKANTNALEDVLQQKQINGAFEILANTVVEGQYTLSKIPHSG